MDEKLIIELDDNKIKYGVFGISLGDELYTRLDNYCEINNIHKSKLIKALLIKYLDEVEKED